MNLNTCLLAISITLLLPVPDATCQDNYPKSADKPLFRDPVYDGAADPVVVWNGRRGEWLMYYTNRRATVTNEEGVSWVHGTRIGIAESSDGGAGWQYLDTCDIRYRPNRENTYWAPEVIEHEGIFHMYLTYVPGIFSDWGHPRRIIHLTSADGLSWKFRSELLLESQKVIDACILKMPDGNWRMWYNNEADKKTMYCADSPDLYTWTNMGKARGIQRGEGAKVFSWKEKYWMIVDEWRGLAVYGSDDLENWQKQPENILAQPGSGADDGVQGQHCDVVVHNNRAYIFYFTHPGRVAEIPDSEVVEKQRSSIQVAELKIRDGKITCDRDLPVSINMSAD
jgi:hypothetical protein